MSKAVMISIRPKWCEKICNGKKTIEVRKTRPKLEPPFKCYIYCTKAKERLIGILKNGDENYGETYHGKPVFIKLDEGSVCDMWGKRQKVIGEFVCDRIFPIDVYDNGCIKDWNFECMWQACLPYEGIAAYIGREKRGYGWHISNLKIYDTPKDLDEFSPVCRYKNDDKSCQSRRVACSYQKCDYNPDGSINLVECGRMLERPPQSWGYVEELR